MSIQTRGAAAWAACMAMTILAAPVGADDAVSGTEYGAQGYGLDVSHTGYPGGAANGNEATAQVTSPNYVVVEVEDGTPEDVGGQTVIVVQEPAPVAATDEAPPPTPNTVAVAQPAVQCPSGIWVQGHWAYADGQYVWVDGHCVVERVNYVFVHPRWDYYSNVWWYVPGYYRPCRVWVGYGYYRPHYWFPPYHHRYYRGYRGVPVHRAPHRPTVTRPVARAPIAASRFPTASRSVPTRSTTVSRSPNRTLGVSRVTPTSTRTVTRSSSGRSPVVRSSPPRSTSVVRGTPTRTSPTRTMTTRTGTVNRGSVGSRARVGTVGRTPSSYGRSSTVTRSTPSSNRMRWGGGSSRPGASYRTNTVNRGSFGRPGFGGSSFGRPSSVGRSMPSMRSGGFARPTSGGGGARVAPISRGR